MDHSSPMRNPTHLRHTAELCRRVAGISTSGGQRADRILLALADKLDREASVSERPAATARLTDDQLVDFRGR